MNSTLWEERSHRRAQQSFRSRIAELWERAQAIYDAFMDAGRAELEISCEPAECKRIKAVLDAHVAGGGARTAESSSGISASISADGKVYDTDRDGGGLAAGQGRRSSSRSAGTGGEERLSAGMATQLPPAELFCKVQVTVLEELRCGAFQRLVGTPEGLRRLALLSVQSPLAL
jgi:hypothetical protein